jgi:hypothetical protein
MLVEGSLGKTSRSHIPPTSTQYEKYEHLSKKHRGAYNIVSMSNQNLTVQ